MTSLIATVIASEEKNNTTMAENEETHQLQVRIAPAVPSPRCKSCTPRLAPEDPQGLVKTSACMRLLSVLGHKSLDEKLLQHDIKRKRSKSARFVRNLMSKSLSEMRTSSFAREDLQKLSVEHLQALRESFKRKLLEKRQEHMEVLNEKATETETMGRFMKDIQNIELAAKTTLKPCVNVLPESDDMARVLLLN